MGSRSITLFDEDGGERELPFKWVICGGCRGHGKSSAYLGAFTAEQIHEDPDFAEDYRSGFYDRACDECGGSGKTKTIDSARTPKKDLQAYRAQQSELAECDAIHRQERLMEGGWREEGWF
jgi:hypothetical protein